MMFHSTAVDHIHGKERNGETKKLISEANVDVTGDGKKERILLFGKLVEGNRQFYKNLTVEVITDDGKEKREVFKKQLGNGYAPTITFHDVTGDNIKDIYVSVPTAENGATMHQSLFTLAEFKSLDLGIPEPLTVNSELKNDLTAFVALADKDKIFKMDLSSRKKLYEQAGLYQDGKLNAPTELVVAQQGEFVIAPLEDGQYGLLSTYDVGGMMEGEVVAQLQATWEWQEGKWVLFDCSLTDMLQKEKIIKPLKRKIK